MNTPKDKSIIQKSKDQIQNKNQVKPPKPLIVRLLFKLIKYTTIISILSFIVLGGVLFLGDNSQPIRQDKPIFNLYKNDQNSNRIIQEVQSLFSNNNKTYLSEKTVNLYVCEESSTSKDEDNKFQDLLHLSDYIIRQKYNGQSVVKLPLNLGTQKSHDLISQSISSKVLQKLKQKIVTFLQKSKQLEQALQSKPITMNKVKKLIQNGKYQQLFQTIKESIIKCLWKWSNDQPAVIVLIANQKIKQIQNKKALRKWIRQNQQHSDIIILSRQSLNEFISQDQQTKLFKSLKVQLNYQNFENSSICQYLTNGYRINNQQCTIIRNQFLSFNDFQQFAHSMKTEQLLMQSQINSQTQRVLSEVCQNGQLGYEFYPGQSQPTKNVKKSTKSTKSTKSRVQKQLEALKGKFAQLSAYIGIDNLIQAYQSFNAKSKKISSLYQLNSLGLIYDFQTHQLKWRSQNDRLFYEIKFSKTCQSQTQVAKSEQNEPAGQQSDQQTEQTHHQQDQQLDQQSDEKTDQEIVQQKDQKVNKNEQQTDEQTKQQTIQQEALGQNNQQAQSTVQDEDPIQTQTDQDNQQTQNAQDDQKKTDGQQTTDDQQADNQQAADEQQGADDQQAVDDQQVADDQQISNDQQAADDQQALSKSSQQKAQNEQKNQAQLDIQIQ